MFALRSPAKLNLDLRIAAPRPDGFHPLSSWFVTIGLQDDLVFQRHPLPGIHLTCNDSSLATDDSNLISRAAKALTSSLPDHHPVRFAGLSIGLKKRIPMGGGLGGGSSNAATTLLGVDRLLSLSLPPEHLRGLAAQLGADVAFFLQGTSALCTGKGEIVDPLLRPSPKAALLILPKLAMPTPAVYREFDRLGLGTDLSPRVVARDTYAGWCELPARELLSRLTNDLEAPAFSLSKALAELRHEFELLLGRPVRMSGSGSTLFTLYDSLTEATAAADQHGAGSDVRVIAVELCPLLPAI